MAFTATPLDGSTTPIPMPTVVPDATNTPLVTEGGPSKVTGGNTLAPVAVYQYDGYNVTQGITTDTAVTGDTSGTISAKLRGLSKIFFDMWDSTNHWLQVKVMNGNANGQATMVNSSPVVLASDELVPIGLNATSQQQWNAVDNVGDNSHTGIGVVAQSAFNGYPNYTYDRCRIANVYKTATATASGDTALWTPTTGTKFRIMRYRVEVTANAAAASGAVLAIVLRDATTALALAHSVFIPAAAGTIMGQGYVSPWIDLSNGPQSALANNVLNVNLSFALTAGNVRVVVAGNEE